MGKQYQCTGALILWFEECREMNETERSDVQCEERSIGLWIGDDCLVPHDSRERDVEVQRCVEGGDDVWLGDVAAIAGKEAVVCECVHHWTRSAEVVWSSRNPGMRVFVARGRACGSEGNEGSGGEGSIKLHDVYC